MRSIRRNLVSFISVVIISLLAVTAYLGISFTAEAMKMSADACYEAQNHADIEVSSSRLFTEKDLETVRSAEGVTDAEGIMYIPSRVLRGTVSENIILQSLSERMNQAQMKEGRMPEAADECAVEEWLSLEMGYGVGDRVELAGRDARTDLVIKTKAFTVTGIFSSAEHLTDMYPFEPLVLVPKEAYNGAVVPEGSCNQILVRIGAEGSRFSSARKETTSGVRERIEELDSGWILSVLSDKSSYRFTEETAGVLDKVSVTFSMLFIAIAALVIYSTISRLVTSDSRLVGATKAMGLKNNEIFAKYLVFGAGGAFIGAVAGILVAYFILERIVLHFFDVIFLYEERVPAFQPAPACIMAGGALILAFAAVFFACLGLMKSTAVTLMNGTETGGLRKKKRSAGEGALYTRLIFRNMRTDWKRVLVSIVSIAGCCLLMMVGFSTKFAISRVTEQQYGKIQKYDMEISMDASQNAAAEEEIGGVLQEEGIPYLGVFRTDAVFQNGEDVGNLTLIACDSGNFSDFFSLEEIDSGKALDVPESGLLVCRRFTEYHHLEAGARFRLYDSSMNEHEAEISGTFENHLGFIAVCGKAYAGERFGLDTETNTLLVRLSGRDAKALRERLSGIKGFISLNSSKKQETLFNGISAMLNLVILLLGVLAFMIACFILLNLVTTYVNRKKNELTIMRINGYTTKETIRYASMECYWITAIGIIAGLAGGQAFSSWLIRLVEQQTVQYVRDPIWVSFAASAAITAAISGVIHYISFRKIRNLKLSDIQK